MDTLYANPRNNHGIYIAPMTQEWNLIKECKKYSTEPHFTRYKTILPPKKHTATKNQHPVSQLPQYATERLRRFGQGHPRKETKKLYEIRKMGYHQETPFPFSHYTTPLPPNINKHIPWSELFPSFNAIT
jgi:hypothetical protein